MVAKSTHAEMATLVTCRSVMSGAASLSVRGDVAFCRIAAASPVSSPRLSTSTRAPSYHSEGMVMPRARRASTRMSARVRPFPGEVVERALPPTAVLTGKPPASHTRLISRIVGPRRQDVHRLRLARQGDRALQVQIRSF